MKSLRQLSNAELEASMANLVQREREILHSILEHICEIKRRELHLRSTSNLCRYLVEKFKYTGGAAMRRIEAARLLEDVPTIATKIEDGSLNLSQLGEVYRAVKQKEKVSQLKITTAEKHLLLEKVTNKTVEETQKELAQALDIQVKEHDSKRGQKDESVRLEITLSKAQYEKLLKCRDKASHTLSQRNMSCHFGDVLEIAMDHYLKLSKKTQNNITSVPKRDNKTLTPKTRREVLERDQQCLHQDPDTGEICGTTFALTVDHKQPRWADGTHQLENLQALCATHNQLKYRRESNLRLL